MHILKLLLLAFLTTATLASAQPAAYPTKPISLIVFGAPETGNDIVSRIFAPPLSRALGQSVVIENQPPHIQSVVLRAVRPG